MRLPQLTDRQRNLLRLINQMSQNTNAAMAGNTEFAVDLPSVDLGVDLGGVSISSPPASTPPGRILPPTPAPGPAPPTSLRELLLTLVNEQVQITTPFGAVSGLLLFVGDDYVAVVEDGSQILIRISQIELVSEL